MKERYRKIHNIKYKTGQNIGIVTHIRVYRNEGKNLVAVHLFLMSNLEGLRIFIKFFVINLLFWIAGKILIEVIQFPVKFSGFFLSRFIGFL